MPLVGKVLDRLVALMQLAVGQTSDYADRDFLAKYVPITNDDLEARLEGLDLNFDTQVVVLTAVPAGTTDLSSYQADGQALGNLIVPSSGDGSSPIEWRVAGLSDLNWQPVPEVGKVIDTNTSTTTGTVSSDSAGVISYEFRGGIIYISPASQTVDMRIRGQFLPTLADNDAAPFIRGLINVLVYRTAWLVLGLGNSDENANAVKIVDELYGNAEFDFTARLSKAKHTQVIRLGGRRTQFPGQIGRFTPPIVG